MLKASRPFELIAILAELADAQQLECCVARRESSSLSGCTKILLADVDDSRK